MCNGYVRLLCSCKLNSCLRRHRKDPWGGLSCVGLRSLALTSKSLRLLVRRKATRGVALKTLNWFCNRVYFLRKLS